MERKWLERCWKEQHAGGYFVSESNIDSVTKGMKMWSQPLWIDKRKRDVKETWKNLVHNSALFCF